MEDIHKSLQDIMEDYVKKKRLHSAFNVGDVVFRIDGGPKMTVNKIYSDASGTSHCLCGFKSDGAEVELLFPEKDLFKPDVWFDLDGPSLKTQMYSVAEKQLKEEEKLVQDLLTLARQLAQEEKLEEAARAYRDAAVRRKLWVEAAKEALILIEVDL